MGIYKDIVRASDLATVSSTANAAIAQAAAAAASGVKAGHIIAHGASLGAIGYLKCNGAALSRATYAVLFAAIGTTWGAGDGSTTFNLPDLRGNFLRGSDDGAGVDVGRVFGSTQADSIRLHNHQQKTALPASPGSVSSGISNGSLGSAWGNSVVIGMTAASGDIETRPLNIAVHFWIKY